MKFHFITSFILALFSMVIGTCQKKFLFQQIDTTKLFMEVYYPQNVEEEQKYPAMIFFFGGGWINGSREHFVNHAKYFSKRGIVCFLPDYRTKEKNGTTPFDALRDAKSALRFVRENDSLFKIDTTRIIASGGSAGGHLAAATALIPKFNHPDDNLSVSCKPDALVLFNPVIDNGPNGYGYERIGKAYKEFSPLFNIKKGAPPTIIFLGTEDELIPVKTINHYKDVMAKVGSRCDVKLYEGQGHGFFNFRNLEFYKKTILEADRFLVSLGYLNE